MGDIISHPSLGSYKKEFMALQHMITCIHIKPPAQKKGWAKESNTETGRSMLHDIKGTIKVNSKTTWRRGTNEGEGWYHNLTLLNLFSEPRHWSSMHAIAKRHLFIHPITSTMKVYIANPVKTNSHIYHHNTDQNCDDPGSLFTWYYFLRGFLSTIINQYPAISKPVPIFYLYTTVGPIFGSHIFLSFALYHMIRLLLI